MFMKNQENIQLTVELLDTEDENSDEPMEMEVSLHLFTVRFQMIKEIILGFQ